MQHKLNVMFFQTFESEEAEEEHHKAYSEILGTKTEGKEIEYHIGKHQTNNDWLNWRNT